VTDEAAEAAAVTAYWLRAVCHGNATRLFGLRCQEL
jgi:hypothetical protein